MVIGNSWKNWYNIWYIIWKWCSNFNCCCTYLQSTPANHADILSDSVVTIRSIRPSCMGLRDRQSRMEHLSWFWLHLFGDKKQIAKMSIFPSFTCTGSVNGFLSCYSYLVYLKFWRLLFYNQLTQDKCLKLGFPPMRPALQSKKITSNKSPLTFASSYCVPADWNLWL